MLAHGSGFDALIPPAAASAAHSIPRRRARRRWSSAVTSFHFLFAQQPFLLAKHNPQLLQGPKYSTAGWVLGGLYGSGTFSRHGPGIYRHSRLPLHRWVLQRVPLVARERRQVHACPLVHGPQPAEGSSRGARSRQELNVGGRDYPNHLSNVPCPLPRRIERVRMSIASPHHAAFPKWQEGRHPHCHFRGLLRLHSRYGLWEACTFKISR
jgi:hypothetical protein